jgi:epoxyqueuosine reductase QueG
MAERMHWRGDPTALWPEARSVIMLAEAYTPGWKTRSPISTGRKRDDQRLCPQPRLPRPGEESG